MSCTKRQYKSESEARKIKKIIFKRARTRLRHYFCKICHYWHLTSEKKLKKPVILYEHEHRFRERDWGINY